VLRCCWGERLGWYVRFKTWSTVTRRPPSWPAGTLVRTTRHAGEGSACRCHFAEYVSRGLPSAFFICAAINNQSLSLIQSTALLDSKPHPPCRGAWEKRLPTPITLEHWKTIASRYNNSLLTPRDYHLHFKHITHRRIGTNNRFADRSTVYVSLLPQISNM